MRSASIRRSQKKSTLKKAVSLPNLKVVQDACLEEFGRSKNTKKAYKGHFARGKAFLKELVDQKRESGTDSDCVNADKLAKAFDSPPNEYSAMALELYLTQKCFSEACGLSTAQGIHGAFANYWDEMDGQKYAGIYSYDKEANKVSGCPARAPSVQAVMDAIKTRSRAKGAAATRQHADAMTIEDLRLMMQWSENECLSSKIEPESGSLVKDVEQLQILTKHAMMRAFSSSAFTLWTRNIELCELQVQDIKFGCVGPAPYYIPHFKVHLDGRKGWQNKAGYDGPRESNIYDIYQQEVPEMDMSSHLMRWLNFLEARLGRPLVKDDYVFPYFAPNGAPHPKRAMSYDTLQNTLTEFSAAAGLDKQYTTHCFRRGGAQYRFMHAPLGKRWSLSMVRWWGGWAIGEHVDTLMKYLVDALQSFESGHGNALYPIRTEPEKSFMGEHIGMQTVTAEEFREMMHAVDRKLENLTVALNFGLSIGVTAMHSGVHSEFNTIPSSSVNTRPVRTLSQGRDLRRTSAAPYHLAKRPETPNGLESDNFDDQTQPILKRSQSVPALLGTASIPDLGRDRGAWRRAIIQWEEGTSDMPQGLALKDWPKAWYTGEMACINGTKRSQRKLIADEYSRFGSDDKKFLQVYPFADCKPLTHLQHAIRKNHPETQRNSRNGTPTERETSLSLKANTAL